MISAIIPVKNGEATLEKCLTAILNQTIADKIEIIVLDSASTDNSVTIAKSFGAQIININPFDFNHGLTRNEGVKYATGELIYFTVQDAYLAENDQLEKMASYFTDAQLSAVVGMQATAHDIDKNPARWFKRFTTPYPETRHFPHEFSFSNLTKKQQFELSSWDNVNAMYRKAALQKIPFIKTNLSEDWLWANEALHNGMKLIRDPSLLVYHYHHLFFNYSFRSTFILKYHFYIFFNQLPKVTWSPLGTLKAVAVVIKRKEISHTKKLYWILHNILASFAGFSSILIFRTTLAIGKKPLVDKVYKLICKEIPQGLQKKIIR